MGCLQWSPGRTGTFGLIGRSVTAPPGLPIEQFHRGRQCPWNYQNRSMKDVGWSDEYEAIVRLLGLRAGLSFQPSERDTVAQAILRTMKLAGCSNTAEYLRLLKADVDALHLLLAATSVGETYFFRDSGQFRIISDLILPDIRRRRGPGHTIRIWSAGCASGEEAYSLAMLLHRSGALSQATILGTDISQEALSLARTAVYPESSLRGAGAKMARPYLTEKDGKYYVNATMKKSVRFETLNLALDNYPSIGSGTRGMDLILCRNELPCFDQQTVDSVVSKLFRSLAEGGWLITAPSDPPILEYEMFDFIPTEDGLAYRKANMSSTANLVGDPHASAALQQQTTGTVSEAETILAPKTKPQDPEPSKVVPRGNKRFAEARQALADGDCQRAADLTTDMRGEGAIIHIKALASIDVGLAAKACAVATNKRPLSQELQYLNAVLMMDLNKHREAVESLQRVLYLDESLALAHFSLGAALARWEISRERNAPIATRWKFAIACRRISWFRSVTTKRCVSCVRWQKLN